MKRLAGYDTTSKDGLTYVSLVKISVDLEDSSGLLVKTDFSDGSRRVVDTNGPFDAIWFDAGGSFEKSEIAFSNGTAFYDASNKPFEFDYSSGGAVTLIKPDGSGVQTNTDGSKLLYAPDGGITFLDPDGTVTRTVAPDGSYKTPIPSGWDYFDHTGSLVKIAVTQASGAIAVTNPMGALIETDFSDGSRRVVDTSGPFNATWFDANGSFEKSEIAFSNGTAFYDASNKPFEFDYSSGGAVTLIKPDGSGVQTNTDGSKLLYAPDGGITFLDPDGTVTRTVAPDGSYKTPIPSGWDYFDHTGSLVKIAVTQASGAIAVTNPMGALIETDFSDGSRRVVDTSGPFNATWFDANGSFEKSEIAFSNGTAFYDASNKPFEFDYSSGGAVTLIKPDGSGVQTNTDGSKLLYAPDGGITFLDPDGTVTRTVAPDGSYKTPIPSGWDYFDHTGSLVKIAVTQASGAIAVTNPMGALIETDFSDGSRRVVDTSGPFNATWFDANGSFEKSEIAFSNGTAFYDASNKPFEFDYSSGGAVTLIKPDGSGVQTNTDGSKLLYAPDGGITFLDPDGTVTRTVAPDGSYKIITGKELVRLQRRRNPSEL